MWAASYIGQTAASFGCVKNEKSITQGPNYTLNPGFLPSHIPGLSPEDADPWKEKTIKYENWEQCIRALSKVYPTFNPPCSFTLIKWAHLPSNTPCRQIRKLEQIQVSFHGVCWGEGVDLRTPTKFLFRSSKYFITFRLQMLDFHVVILHPLEHKISLEI